jgi:hypothetical protein
MAGKDKHKQFYQACAKVHDKAIELMFNQNGNRGTYPKENKGYKTNNQKAPPVVPQYVSLAAFERLAGKRIFFPN